MDWGSFLQQAEVFLGTDRLAPQVRALVWKASGIVLLGIAFFIFANQWNTGNRLTNVALGALKMVFTLGVAYAGAVAYIRGRRIAAKPAADDRPPVLYLRSFRADAQLAQPLTGDLPFPSLSSEEEHLAQGFRPIGPFKAFGIPREPLAPLGAVREYWPEDKWKEHLRERMIGSRLIVLRVGDTPSLRWELALAVQNVPPEKLVLLVAAPAEYETFRANAAQVLPKPLPAYAAPKPRWLHETRLRTTASAIVYFSRDWSPHFVPLLVPRWRVGKPLARALVSALAPVCQQINLPWQPPPVSLPKVVGAAAIVFGAIWLVIDLQSGPVAITQAVCQGGGSSAQLCRIQTEERSQAILQDPDPPSQSP